MGQRAGSQEANGTELKMKKRRCVADVTSKRRKYKFSGHQTFAFRYGWLEKGVREMLKHPDLFSRDDALVLLGVGKNMVESIRHWCTVTQLVEEDGESKKTGASALRVSAIGKMLLDEDDGWDPFLEDDASLWLVHWLLVSNPTIVTTWQIAFSLFQRPDFTKRELADYVAAFADKNGVSVNQSSLARDVECFIRTYTAARTKAKQLVLEESFDCPLQELSLIQSSPDGEVYRFSVGMKPTLPSAVFGYALLQYFDTVRAGRNTMSVQECLYGPGSPGQAFKLDENTLVELMEELERITRGKVALDETTGLKQIYRREDMDALKLLKGYYRREASK
jgi:hypothetical protein